MGLVEWLWSLLPDTCEVSDCCRAGVRGNENRIYPWDDAPDFHIVMCDYCSSRYMHGEVMKVDGLWSRIVVNPEGNVVDIRHKRVERKHVD